MSSTGESHLTIAERSRVPGRPDTAFCTTAGGNSEMPLATDTNTVEVLTAIVGAVGAACFAWGVLGCDDSYYGDEWKEETTVLHRRGGGARVCCCFC